jgi:hypothetical protein
MLPSVAVVLLLCVDSPTLSAQPVQKEDDREQERKSSRPSGQNREQKTPPTSERDRSRQEAEWRLQREREERREIRRRQDAMREADLERAATRRQQNDEWAREMELRRQREQPVPSGTYGTPNYTPPARSTRGPYSAPAATGTARQGTKSSPVTCSAHPNCMSEAGRINVCRGVQASYTGAGASNDGLRDIITRCRDANLPEPCNADPRGTPANPNYRLSPIAGCVQQCATVARCTPSAAR